ncbi:MAG: UDP-2,3-diacylglucosamine diphosphatase LpxI [Pseudomonadota bacterium]|nr:UDP-2,3-diacylglucosamine diphosphatase LpxI [Desulfobacterales bacterium]MBL7102293.1 UDP-2,3-diacylglucosamine diphosphatase LpxI [Desulfobacteraceae bacterium]MBL7171555.1 UDP-2,3-diacylglucosamine diphosphatase LpxI [Desulfobacteraceae bacterium]MBU0735435.1 UDP-2,3-diacylglucosamine diphosphatase LpxI [Pseudomonadota bacterium]
MAQNSEIIGMIAGGGQFPLLIAEAAKKHGVRMIAVAHHNETEPSLSDKVDEIVWIKLGQLGHLIKAFKESGVRNALMAGTITKKRMFENIRPDLKGLTLMSKLPFFHDDDILKAVTKELAREGIEIISSTRFLPELLAPEGCLTARKPDKAEREDVHFGWKMAKELGRLDLGQCVVVRKKTVLAVEAIDGTDATILRGGRLAGEKAVVVKVSKPNQDLRFDVPCVGLGTIKAMSRVRCAVLAVEKGCTLLFDKSEMIAEADRENISIISLSSRVY